MLVIFMECKTKLAFIRKDDREYETRNGKMIRKIWGILCKTRYEVLANRYYCNSSKTKKI